MRRDVETFLIDATDVAMLRPPFLPAVMYWRSHIAERKPRCAACKTLFAADAIPQVGGWLFAQPCGTNAISVTPFCRVCWDGLNNAALEAVAVKVLRAVKPNAKFADAPPEQ